MPSLCTAFLAGGFVGQWYGKVYSHFPRHCSLISFQAFGAAFHLNYFSSRSYDRYNQVTRGLSPYLTATMQEGKRSMENDHDSDYHAEEGLLDLSRLSDYSFVDQLHLRDPTSRESDDLLRKPPSPPAVPPPPDGGSLAWLQCAGAFFIYFNTWGFVNSYGKSW